MNKQKNLFSFSLYFLALRPVMGIGNEEMKWVGAITPLGGISFILGWISLSAAGINFEKKISNAFLNCFSTFTIS